MWFNEHSSGQALTFDAVEKFNNGSRPVEYCANGAHAT
jgi:hypothetical protein